MNDMDQAKKLAAELGLDKAPEQGEKLSAMESAYRMTPNYYVEQLDKRKREAAESDDGEGALPVEDYGRTCQLPKPEPRDLDVITQEIVFYKRQAGAALMEIGNRLNEAKEQLEHGQWLDWLREKVDISERNAQNFMRIAREYSKSAEIADLGATKALALLALPDSERNQFAAEKHAVNGEEKAVADMTGEELKKAIRERNEALKRAQEAQDGLSDAQRERDQALSQLEGAKKAGEQAAAAKLDALKVKSDGLEEKLKTAREKEKEAKAGLENAKAEKEELEKKLEELKKKPVEVAVREPGEEELKKIREDAEAAAEEKVKAANARLMEEQARADAAESEAKKAKAALELSDQTLTVFQVFFNEWQKTYRSMIDALMQVKDPETAKKLRNAIVATAGPMGAAE